MASALEGSPSVDVPGGVSLLGFCHMVAPVNKVARPEKSGSVGSTVLGHVPELQGGAAAPPQVAPDLHVVLRRLLEEQNIKSEVVSDYLAGNPSIKRYNSAFKALFGFLLGAGVDPCKAGISEVVSGLISLHKVSPAQARNAYSAMLLLPGFSQLQFHPLLRSYKRSWQQSVERYACFWDCGPVVAKLATSAGADASAAQQFDFLKASSVAELRCRLIMVMRLLCLFRSVDLSHVLRTVSFDGAVPFVLVKRKGWSQHKWERLLCLPEQPLLSPWHVMQEYVARTFSQAPPGGSLFLSLARPFRALGSEAIASVTKRFLSSCGVRMDVWGPHSTRGAGVAFYRKLGLSSEEVCELGKWKNVSTFASHYQRLGAQGWLKISSPP